MTPLLVLSISTPKFLAGRNRFSHFSRSATLVANLGLITPQRLILPSSFTLNIPDLPSSTNSNSPMYPRSAMTFSVVPISLEAGWMIHSGLPTLSAFFITDIASASGSNNTLTTYENFSKPISGAISRKHCLHRYIPYFLTSPAFLPQRRHWFAPLPKLFLVFFMPPPRSLRRIASANKQWYL